MCIQLLCELLYQRIPAVIYSVQLQSSWESDHLATGCTVRRTRSLSLQVTVTVGITAEEVHSDQ